MTIAKMRSECVFEAKITYIYEKQLNKKEKHRIEISGTDQRSFGENLSDFFINLSRKAVKL